MKTKKHPVILPLIFATCFATSPAMAADPPALTIAELVPQLDGREVTLTFTVTGTDGVSQFTKPGKAMTFVIETEAESDTNGLVVWVSGDLADVMERLQMGLFSPNLKKGTKIEATGRLLVSKPGEPRAKLQWYRLEASDWKKFRILQDRDGEK